MEPGRRWTEKQHRKIFHCLLLRSKSVRQLLTWIKSIHVSGQFPCEIANKNVARNVIFLKSLHSFCLALWNTSIRNFCKVPSCENQGLISKCNWNKANKKIQFICVYALRECLGSLLGAEWLLVVDSQQEHSRLICEDQRLKIIHLMSPGYYQLPLLVLLCMLSNPWQVDCMIACECELLLAWNSPRMKIHIQI